MVKESELLTGLKSQDTSASATNTRDVTLHLKMYISYNTSSGMTVPETKALGKAYIELLREPGGQPHAICVTDLQERPCNCKVFN